MSLLHAITGRTWLITDAMLTMILDIAGREQHDLDAARAALDARREALAVRDGRPLDGARYTTVRDGVAVIEVIGPIFRYANLFTAFSGGTATELLAQDLRIALDDPGVRAILFAFDSPGGEATGIHELAQQIHDARGTKPLIGYGGGMVASAAYWMASGCDEIVIDATAELGSIGAVIALPNPEARSGRQIEIVSSQSPNKRPDPTTEKGRGQYQQRVDSLADVFVADVARNRGVSVESVLADFGQGGVLVGQAAIDAGLADRIGSFEGLVAELTATPSPAFMRPRGAAAQEERSMAINWKDVFGGMFKAAEEQGAPIVGNELATLTTEVQPAQSATAAELERTRAELAALQAAQAKQAEGARETAAVTFAEAQIAASRAVPADRDALVAVHRACAAAGCEAQLTTLFAARPAHALTTEVLPVGVGVQVLPVAAATDTDVAQARADAQAYAQKVNTKK